MNFPGNLSGFILRSLNNLCRFSTKSTKKFELQKILLKMPREPKHIAEAQKQRLKIKKKSEHYVPGTVNIQVLGSGAPGSPATLYLFTDQWRFENI